MWVVVDICDLILERCAGNDIVHFGQADEDNLGEAGANELSRFEA